MKLGSIALSLILTATSIFAAGCAGTATPAPTAAPAAIAEAAITAKGEVVPEHYSRVAFTVGGTVAQIPVQEGAQVTKGNTLAILDTSDLQLQLKTAQDALALAEASLAQARTPASEEELAALEAAYQSALAGLERVTKPATESDLAAARAAYNSALTAYNRAKNGPTKEEMEILQSQLAKAQAAVNVAQAAYDRIGGASNPFSAQTPQALQLQQATQDYQIALSNYNKAVQPDASVLAQAQAQLAQANAALKKLQEAATAEDIAQAQAQVDSAKAQLDLKKKGARPEDLRVTELRVEQARTGVEQAQAQLDKATLVAPMDGTVTEIAIREGEQAAPGQPLFTIADLSNLKIETTDLDEFGAAKVAIGQPASIRVNAFTDKTLTGKVTEIADQAVMLTSGDVSYPVTIVLDAQDPELRWGMTVKVEFIQ
ncbi:MAG: efflux RND transporter periplasmic adaptor subunit [Anaerolineae bacterium]|nr:efflux RND transporter periplasmic adaptor subunit [Anaerolineae bacterium]